MNFYWTYLLALCNERYEDHYWQHCEFSDRFWMSVFDSLNMRSKP